MKGKGVWLLGIVITVACCFPAALNAGDITARARVDSTHYLIGDWIRVYVDIRHPKGVVFQPIVGDTVSGFHIIQRWPSTTVADTLTSTGFLVSRYDSGQAILPPLPFLYSLPGDTSTHTVSTNPLLLTVSTVPVDTTKDIKDIKSPLSISLSLADVAFYISILLLCAGFAYLVYRFWKKRKSKQTGEVYIPSRRPAHLVALEELAVLKGKKLWQQGLIKQYYSEVTEILRRYIENRYGLMALEETTDEILNGLSTIAFPPDGLQKTEIILRRADLVKFAKYIPGIPEHEEMMIIVYDIVEKTKAVAMTPVSPTETGAAAHVGS